MLTLELYWMGRDARYPASLTDEIRENAAITCALVSELLDEAAADGVHPGIDPQSKTIVSSGWRPPEINSHTPNAAPKSKHKDGEAVDIRDTPDRALARWCLANPAILERLGLWCERPQWTPTWVHFQTRPPGSGRRFFVPSSAAPLAAALPGEEA